MLIDRINNFEIYIYGCVCVCVCVCVCLCLLEYKVYLSNIVIMINIYNSIILLYYFQIFFKSIIAIIDQDCLCFVFCIIKVKYNLYSNEYIKINNINNFQYT